MLSGLFGGEEEGEEGESTGYWEDTYSGGYYDNVRMELLHMCKDTPIRTPGISVWCDAYGKAEFMLTMELHTPHCSVAQIEVGPASVEDAQQLRLAFERHCVLPEAQSDSTASERRGMVGHHHLGESLSDAAVLPAVSLTLRELLVLCLHLGVSIKSVSVENSALLSLLPASSTLTSTASCDSLHNIILSAMVLSLRVNQSGVCSWLQECMRCKEVLPGIVYISSKLPQLVSCFMFLFSETYESPLPEHRGQVLLDRAEAIARLMLPGLSNQLVPFCYYTEWPGFNVPQWVFAAYGKHLEALQPVERHVLTELSRCVQLTSPLRALDTCEELYVCAGATGQDDTYVHEVAHAMYTLDPRYAEGSRLLFRNVLDQDQYDAVVDHLVGMGYACDVADDEMQAYFLTGRSLGLPPSAMTSALREGLAALFRDAVQRRCQRLAHDDSLLTEFMAVFDSTLGALRAHRDI